MFEVNFMSDGCFSKDKISQYHYIFPHSRHARHPQSHTAYVISVIAVQKYSSLIRDPPTLITLAALTVALVLAGGGAVAVALVTEGPELAGLAGKVEFEDPVQVATEVVSTPISDSSPEISELKHLLVNFACVAEGPSPQ